MADKKFVKKKLGAGHLVKRGCLFFSRDDGLTTAEQNERGGKARPLDLRYLPTGIQSSATQVSRSAITTNRTFEVVISLAQSNPDSGAATSVELYFYDLNDAQVMAISGQGEHSVPHDIGLKVVTCVVGTGAPLGEILIRVSGYSGSDYSEAVNTMEIVA
jgi:hypothetical protein